MNNRSDYGAEILVYAHTARALGRRKEGAAVAAQPTNQWTFVTADDPRKAEVTRELVPLSAEALLDDIKQVLISRGAHGIAGVGRVFRIMDDRGDRKLDREDIKYGLRDCGLHLTDEEFEVVLQRFDRNRDGLIDFDEFLVALRGEINDFRRTFIQEAFRRLDKDGSGEVTLADIKMAYDASQNPAVQSGQQTADDCLRQFMSQWDTLKRDGIVTYEEFEEYYKVWQGLGCVEMVACMLCALLHGTFMMGS